MVEKLLEVDFPGRDELRTQLASIKAKQIEEDGTLRLLCDSGLPSSGKFALVSEGACKDGDGGDVSVMLHLNKDGFMTMLEIIKYGPAPIITPPSADDLVVLMPERRGDRAGGPGF
ncbi:MAG: hypothetical protein WBX38_07555 [Candidatus Sulfotelmatobacter sp.]